MMDQNTFLLVIQASPAFKWLMNFCYGYETRPKSSKLTGDKVLHHHVYKNIMTLKYGGHDSESEAWLLHYAIYIHACIWKEGAPVEYPFGPPPQVGTYVKLVVSPTVSYPFPRDSSAFKEAVPVEAVCRAPFRVIQSTHEKITSTVDAFLKSLEGNPSIPKNKQPTPRFSVPIPRPRIPTQRERELELENQALRAIIAEKDKKIEELEGYLSSVESAIGAWRKK